MRHLGPALDGATAGGAMNWWQKLMKGDLKMNCNRFRIPLGYTALRHVVEVRHAVVDILHHLSAFTYGGIFRASAMLDIDFFFVE